MYSRYIKGKNTAYAYDSMLVAEVVRPAQIDVLAYELNKRLPEFKELVLNTKGHGNVVENLVKVIEIFEPLNEFFDKEKDLENLMNDYKLYLEAGKFENVETLFEVGDMDPEINPLSERPKFLTSKGNPVEKVFAKLSSRYINSEEIKLGDTSLRLKVSMLGVEELCLNENIELIEYREGSFYTFIKIPDECVFRYSKTSVRVHPEFLNKAMVYASKMYVTAERVKRSEGEPKPNVVYVRLNKYIKNTEQKGRVASKLLQGLYPEGFSHALQEENKIYFQGFLEKNQNSKSILTRANFTGGVK